MSLENMKLLYVEDEKELREVMKDILSMEVEELFIAKDGLEGYEMYKNKKPDIIVTDLAMPNMNGVELISKIRETDHSIRAIMLTAHSDVDNLLAATELKLTKYIIKPTKGDELFDALDLAVEEIENFAITSKTKLDLPDSYSWDFSQQTLAQNKQDIRLTPKERKILNFLFSNINKVLTYDNIILDVWEDSDLYSLDNLKTMMKNLRRKVPKDLIKNVYGVGFKVEL